MDNYKKINIDYEYRDGNYSSSMEIFYKISEIRNSKTFVSARYILYYNAIEQITWKIYFICKNLNKEIIDFLISLSHYILVSDCLVKELFPGKFFVCQTNFLLIDLSQCLDKVHSFEKSLEIEFINSNFFDEVSDDKLGDCFHIIPHRIINSEFKNNLIMLSYKTLRD